MKHVLVALFALSLSACSTVSDQPPYNGKGPKGTVQVSSDSYFKDKAWCENGTIKASGVTCQVDYRHAFTKISKGHYSASVSVLQGCGGQTAASITASLANDARYNLEYLEANQVGLMTQVSTGKTYAVNIKLSPGQFTLQAVGSAKISTFKNCP